MSSAPSDLSLSTTIVYLNGEYLPQEQAKISPNDRGFLFGEGIYEAIPFYCGKPFALDLHQKRLERGLEFLSIQVDITEKDPSKAAPTTPSGTINRNSFPLKNVCSELFTRNGMDQLPRAMIYLQITRGSFPTRSHVFPQNAAVKPTMYAFVQPISFPDRKRWHQGYTVASEPDRRWGRVDMKTIQLLPNVMAFQDAKEQQGVDEALLVKDGVAMEGAHNNFWAVFPAAQNTKQKKDTEVCTLPLEQQYVVVTHPANTHAILPGITRAIVVEEAKRAGFLVEERPITVEELRDKVVEAFFTSTTSEVKPAIQIDGRQVGVGTAGPITQRLHHIFMDRVERDTGVLLQSTWS